MIRVCVKAVTEPDSVEPTEITDRARTESTELQRKNAIFRYRFLAPLPVRFNVLIFKYYDMKIGTMFHP